MSERNGYRSQANSEDEDARNINSEGTAARTRPCSIEDIILKRYSKKLVKDAKDGSTKIKSGSGQSDSENTSEQSKRGTYYGHGMDPASESVQLKKKNALEEEHLQKDTLSRKEEKHSSKKTGSLEKAEIIHYPTMLSRIKSQKDKGNLKAVVESFKPGGKVDKHEKRSHHRSKGDGDYHTEDAKKESKGTKDRLKEKHRDKQKLEEREGKRKHEDEKDNKRKIENDRSGKRKHEARSHIPEKVDRRQEDDYLERKERWKDSSHVSRHKEIKSKHSKRSRSPEHKKTKERGRSPSTSPRLHKRHSSYHGKDHDRDRSSLNPLKERSEKDCPDSERNEKDKNGPSAPYGGHYRRYGGGTSGLGGYSPRRRRSETAVKTPSPPSHSPERKHPAWDLPPSSGMDSNMVASMVSAYQASTLQIGASSNAPALSTASMGMPTIQKSNPSVPVLIPSLFHQVNPLVDAVELTQSTRPSRRLFVDNLPSSVSDGELMEFLNATLLSASANHLPGTQPCISCVVNEDKNHAFAEFLTPEDATAALALDGIMLKGTTLKIKRPKDFVEPAIFIGGISHILSSDKVKEIVTAFGQLKAYHFEVNTEKKPPEVFAFLEYVDPSVTLKACAGLNGMRLGDGILSVVQATPDASGEAKVGSIPFYGIPEHAKPLMEKPTRVLELRNVITKDELLQMSETELEEISEDIRIECTRFGTVKSVNIVRCNDSSLKDSIAPDASQNLGTCINSIQNRENGNSQMCLPGQGEDQNHLECLKEQQKGTVEDTKENARETKAGVSDFIESSKHPEGEQSIEHHVVNMLDENGASDGSNDNAARHFSQATPDKRQHGDSGEANELACADKNEQTVTPESVNALDLGGNSIDRGLAEWEIEGRQQSSLDPDNMQIPAIKKNEEGHLSEKMKFQQVGSVLVEFSREEAVCLAAHTLHGRLYGSQKVIASYFPHSLYQKRFPRGSLR
eukprot:Gb_32245 [translate_table: standard]